MLKKTNYYTLFWFIWGVIMITFVSFFIQLLSEEEEPKQTEKDLEQEIDSLNLSIFQEETIIDTFPEGMDTTTQHILVTGDSMAKALAYGMMPYAQYNGHKLTLFRWVSSSTKSWSETDSLRKLIELHQPTYVIFTLGSNELPYKNTSYIPPFLLM